MATNFNELTLDNIGIWPNSAKGVVVGIICVLILGMGYWFDTRAQVRTLSQVRQEESDLKIAYEAKHAQSANLEIYKEQVKKMHQMFSKMLSQLPERTEIPQLIEDISKVGIANGLEFKLIKPSPESMKDFYTELPIEISVIGTYHQFAEFVSSIASLPRIVTLNDFQIEHLSDEEKKELNQSVGAGSEKLLKMQITAKTYKYEANAPQANGDEEQGGDN